MILALGIALILNTIVLWDTRRNLQQTIDELDKLLANK